MSVEPAVRRPRILFVNRYYRPDQSATSQLLTDLAEAMAARGHDVHVLCSRQLYGEAASKLPPRELLGGVQVHRLAATRFGRGRLAGRALDYASFYAAGALRLLRLLRAGDVAVVKTDPPLLSLVAAPIARLRGAAFLTWQQDVFPEAATELGANPLPPVIDRLLRGLRDASMRAARVNVLISESMRAHFVARGLPRAKLTVIDNWADAAITPKPPAASALRARLGLQDHFVVGYSGNLGRAHEYATLLGAAAALAPDRSFAFLMIGGGAKMRPLQEAVRARGLGNFRFLPYQPRGELGDSLAAADVHLAILMPALEGLILPSKLYGILAAGRPVVFIGDRGGGVAGIVRGAHCGHVVDIGDAAGLAAVLRRMRGDASGLAAMGAAARAAYTARYSADVAVSKWLDALDVKPARRGADARTPAP